MNIKILIKIKAHEIKEKIACVATDILFYHVNRKWNKLIQKSDLIGKKPKMLWKFTKLKKTCKLQWFILFIRECQIHKHKNYVPSVVCVYETTERHCKTA